MKKLLLSFLIYIIMTDNPVCHLHQINGGSEEAAVVGDTATAMFEGTGPSAANVVSDYIIRFQQRQANGRFLTIRRLLCSQAGTYVFCSHSLLKHAP